MISVGSCDTEDWSNEHRVKLHFEIFYVIVNCIYYYILVRIRDFLKKKILPTPNF